MIRYVMFRHGTNTLYHDMVFHNVEVGHICHTCIFVYFHIVKHHVMIEDICSVSEHDIPDHDVLLAGFPCQAFSVLGVADRHMKGNPTGFRDKAKGTLFFDVARILDVKRPKAFCLENVPGLLFHEEGRTFETITQILTQDLGYHVTSCLLYTSPSPRD